ESQTQDVAPDEVIDIPYSEFSIPHMRIKEWNTKSDGTGESYTGETLTMPSYDLTLYAIWELVWEGDGSSGQPYKVILPEHLDAVRDKMNENEVVHFIQIVDIALTGYENWIPVGNNNKPFTGVYDGDGYSITDLVINLSGQDNVGLFGIVSGGTLKNVHIKNAQVTGKTKVGILVGFLKGGGRLANCTVIGTVDGASHAGGLVGDVENNLSNIIEDCGAAVQVTAPGDYVGGLVGNNRGTMNRCYSTGDVYSSNGAYIGGLAGDNWDGHIKDSYATGNVTGRSNVGGLVGWHGYSGTEIRNCYSTGQVRGASAGGLIGVNSSGSVLNSYYNQETSGQSDTVKGTPLTTAQMKAQTSFVDWDFVDTWRITEGFSYPSLQWQLLTDDEKITSDAKAISWDSIKGANGEMDKVTENLNLPHTGAEGSTITWSANPSGFINTDSGEVTRPTGASETVTLTATISKDGGTSQTKTFELTIVSTNFEEDGCLVTYQGAQKRFNDDSNTYDIRFIATIDTLDAKEVGFVFSKSEQTPTRENAAVQATTTVYTSVTAAGLTVTAESLGGTYIVACTVTEIPESDIEIQLYVRAFSTVGTETKYTPVTMVTVNSLP
ncbi:MAG: GLUG motif-containing protein, partial [Desulfitobacteriaceae bacterium]|nr:GLUG motif-containing protein [Desulfitobacteriaceae bacterium]